MDIETIGGVMSKIGALMKDKISNYFEEILRFFNVKEISQKKVIIQNALKLLFLLCMKIANKFYSQYIVFIYFFLLSISEKQ